jgi:hypothetical protein
MRQYGAARYRRLYGKSNSNGTARYRRPFC